METFEPNAEAYNWKAHYAGILTERGGETVFRQYHLINESGTGTVRTCLALPGFMSMVAVYFILKAVGLTEGAMIRLALILCYSGGAALSFQIAKGFFDTTPMAIDEASMIDGCTRWQIFTKITLPLSKPIVIYTILTSFIGPWVDFIFAKVIHIPFHLVQSAGSSFSRVS